MTRRRMFPKTAGELSQDPDYWPSQRAKQRSKELQQSIQRLTRAKARLLRMARTECQAIRAKAKRNTGIRRRAAAADATAVCAVSRGRALSQYGSALRKLIDELIYQRSIYGTKTRAPRRRATKREQTQEHFNEQEASIPAELLPLWRKIGRSPRFKPKRNAEGRMLADRWELFLEYAEENPEEVYDAAQGDADDYLAQMIAEYENAA